MASDPTLTLLIGYHISVYMFDKCGAKNVLCKALYVMAVVTMILMVACELQKDFDVYIFNEGRVRVCIHVALLLIGFALLTYKPLREFSS